MKPKTTLVAFVIVLLFGVYIWYFERGEPMKEGQLLNLSPANATAIELVKDGETIALERRGDNWFITSPISGQADDDAVKSIIEDLARFTPKATRKGEDLSDERYGLADPAVAARVDFGSKTVELSLGNEPVTGEFYAKLSGDGNLYTVPSIVKTHLDKAAEDLRERDIAKFETKDIRELALIRGEERVRLVNEPEKPKDGTDIPVSKWRITEPVQARADSTVVDTVARTISNLRVDQFADVAPPGGEEAMGFHEPTLIASVGLADGTDIMVEFGAEVEKVDPNDIGPKPDASDDSADGEKAPEYQRYVRRQGRDETFLVSAQSFADVYKTLSDLRDKKLMDIIVGDIERFSLERTDGNSFSGRKIDGNWHVTAGGAQTIEADTFKTEDLLYDLKDLEVASFVEGEPTEDTGLDAPSMVVELVAKGSAEPVRIRIGRKSGDQYYAQLEGDSQIIMLDAYKIDGLHDELSDFQRPEEAKGEGGATEGPLGESE